MRVLELLACSPLSAPQLAAELHAQPRTVRRVLSRLVDEGYVALRDERRRTYEPTMRIVALGGQVLESSALVREARPYVALLRERVGASAHLVVPSSRSALCLVRAAVRGDTACPRLHEAVPAHCTAGGKVLLAWDASWRERVLAAPLERCTERTVVDPVALRQALEDVRATGRASEDGEHQPDVRAVAVPVLVAGEVLAALAVCGARLDDGVLAPLSAVARELGAHLDRERCSR